MRLFLAATMLMMMLVPLARADCPGPLSNDPRTREIVDCINFLLKRLEGSEGGRPNGEISEGSGKYETVVSGIRASVVSVGKNGQSITIAINLTNLTDNVLGIALIGPPPQAILAGSVYHFYTFSGAHQCDNMAADYAQTCMTLSGKTTSIPAHAYTRLTPGSTTSVTFSLWTKDKKPGSGRIVSFSCSFSLLQYEGINKPMLTGLGIGIPGIDITSFQ